MTQIVRKIEFGLEICYKIGENYPEILKKYWGEDIIVDFLLWFKRAQDIAISKDINYISLMFNIDDLSDIDNAIDFLKKILKISKIPLIIKGTGDKNTDKILLPKLIEATDKPSIFAPIQDDNYKEIVGAIVKSKVVGHKAILRTPIDINLTKELNILSIDCGLDKNDIIVDPDTGCIGYGIDYGYSIIERMLEAQANGDDTLDTPIVVFSGYESYRAKEAKTSLGNMWGDDSIRSYAWEISTTTALLYAGANIAILWHPNVIDSLKGGFSGLC